MAMVLVRGLVTHLEKTSWKITEFFKWDTMRETFKMTRKAALSPLEMKHSVKVNIRSDSVCLFSYLLCFSFRFCQIDTI